MSRDRVVGGHPKPHICNQRPQFAYSLYNFYGATMTIKGSLHGASIPHPREGGLRQGENFWLCITAASAQCLRLSERFFIVSKIWTVS